MSIFIRQIVLSAAVKRLFAFMIIVAAILPQLSAQDEPIISQYIYHTNVFNPAVAGNVTDVTISALARQQWVGFNGAPSTQVLDAYGYIPKAKSGIGLVFVNDMLGEQGSASLRISYAYCQKINDKAKLSFGLSGGFLDMYVKGSQLIYQETSDPGAIYTNISRWKPYFSAGTEFTGYNFTAGFSVTNLDQSLKDATLFKEPRNYFGYVKYSWDINANINFTPSVFIRSAAFITQPEINLAATFKKKMLNKGPP